MEKIYADLHIHSNYSDGTSTLEEIITLAKINKVEAVALVDHDTVDGVAELKRIGKDAGIDIINGVEISTSINKTRIHLLGYGIDLENGKLREYLREISAARTENTKAILMKNIKRGSIKYEWNEVMKYFGNYSWINSSHVFEAMKNDGIYKAWNDFPDFYTNNFGINSGVYEDIEGFSPESAIEVILEAGGIPVIAHPKLINDDTKIPELIECGAKGIEVYHPTQKNDEITKYKKIAEQNNLIVTGGTDWHGELGRYGVKIGGCGINKEECVRLKNF